MTRILVQNQGSLPFSLDIGGPEGIADARNLLAPKGTPGDTADIGDRLNPWDANVGDLLRRLVVPFGGTRVITPVTGGYRVSGVPLGQVTVTFLEDPQDLVFLFFGGGSGSDHKVAVDGADTTPDFLGAKLTSGTGISLTTLNPGGDEQVQVTNTAPADGRVLIDGADTTRDYLGLKLAAGTGIAFTVLNPGGDEQLRIDTTGSSGLTPAQHEVLRQLIHFVDEGPGHGFANPAYKVVTGGLFPTNVTWYLDAGLTLKLIAKDINRTGPSGSLVKPNPITWTVYALDGVTPLQTATDVITYSGVAEVSRVRTFT